jgi:integrase
MTPGGTAGRNMAARPEGGTVGELASWWLLGLAGSGSVSAATLGSYTRCCHNHIVPWLGGLPVAGLTGRDVQQWLTDLGAGCPDSGRGRLAPASVRGAWRVLRVMLNAAVEHGLVTVNVATGVRPADPPPRPRPQPWTVAEAARFLDSARLGRDPLYPGYLLVLLAGLRASEAVRLTWADVDLASGLIRLDPAPAPRLQVPDPCLAVLRRHRLTGAGSSVDGIGPRGRGLVVTTGRGRPVRPAQFNQALRQQAARAGVPPVGAHLLGATTAGLLIAMDVPPAIAAGIVDRRRLAPPRQLAEHIRAAATDQTHTRLNPPTGTGEPGHARTREGAR